MAKRASDEDVKTWLQHCEESGNWTGAAKALEELNKRGLQPNQHNNHYRSDADQDGSFSNW